MVSTCPNCKVQVTHEDFLFEVECQCGMHFNPFYDLHQNSESDPNVAVNSEPDGFSESKNAFEDIVKFGETMEESSVNTNTKTKIKTKKSEESAKAETPSDKGLAPVNAPASHDGDILMTAGSQLHNAPIDKWLNPVSALCPIDTESDNPLEKGFKALWKQCEKSGGNALVELKWRITPDGSSCLFSGVPVRCEKIS